MAFAFMTDHASLAVAEYFVINLENSEHRLCFLARDWVIAIVEPNIDLP